MNTKQLLGITVGLMVGAGAASAQTSTTNFLFSVNQWVPDANANGLSVTTNLSILGGAIDSVTLSLDILGGYNGDLYAYLTGPHGGFAVLLNRVGVFDNTSSFGYGNPGFDIVMSDAANDVHLYQSGSYTLNSSGQLTGTWAPDGRNIDPRSAPSLIGSTSPTARLNSFIGTDPNGEWTLFVSDLSAGAQSQLVSWSLNVITVPEPCSWTLGVLGLGLLTGMSRMRRRNRVK